MRQKLLIAALAAAALGSVAAVAAHADGCVDTGKLFERAGSCTWDDGRCASVYADATPQIMDDGYSVWACSAGEGGPAVCVAHARTSRCVPLR